MNDFFQKHFDEETAVFKLFDKLTPTTAALLRKEFWDCLPEGNVRRLVIDLQQVRDLDSVSVSLLVATKNVVTKCRGCMVLIGVSRECYEFLEKTHLDKYFEIRESLEEAMIMPFDFVRD